MRVEQLERGRPLARDDRGCRTGARAPRPSSGDHFAHGLARGHVGRAEVDLRAEALDVRDLTGGALSGHHHVRGIPRSRAAYASAAP